jgi:hypothetical protein
VLSGIWLITAPQRKKLLFPNGTAGLGHLDNADALLLRDRQGKPGNDESIAAVLSSSLIR